jgi:hypothetical protein
VSGTGPACPRPETAERRLLEYEARALAAACRPGADRVRRIVELSRSAGYLGRGAAVVQIKRDTAQY